MTTLSDAIFEAGMVSPLAASCTSVQLEIRCKGYCTIVFDITIYFRYCLIVRYYSPDVTSM